MLNNQVTLPSHLEIKEHSISALSQYWENNEHLIYELAIPQAAIYIPPGKPLKLIPVYLPTWAEHFGVEGTLLVPEESIPDEYMGLEKNLWCQVDWFTAVFLLLECWHERLWEQKYGPIHSYSFRLRDWDDRAWEHAWVNRIGLFLREWAANQRKMSPDLLFGMLPHSRVQMTHDVDAITKTLAIRLKQSVFIFFNAMREIFHGNFSIAVGRFRKAFNFFFSCDKWDFFDHLLAEENAIKIKSIFHFYADLRPKDFRAWLFDPGYMIESQAAKDVLSQIIVNKHEIGLHPGYDSWDKSEDLLKQKNALQEASGVTITAVRQHWLRFSWAKTWASQESAGLRLDSTLMFNDRSGFRNSSLLRWNPWNSALGEPFTLEAVPSLMMDSHFYDYQQLDDSDRKDKMNYWLSECSTVSGEGSVLWHPHTLTKDYGWSTGFSELLDLIKLSEKQL